MFRAHPACDKNKPSFHRHRTKMVLSLYRLRPIEVRTLHYMSKILLEEDRFISPMVSCLPSTDGERCGDTLYSIFENAKHPDKVIVGLAEQNDPSDAFCLEEYCKRHGMWQSSLPHY